MRTIQDPGKASHNESLPVNYRPIAILPPTLTSLSPLARGSETSFVFSPPYPINLYFPGARPMGSISNQGG